jgi:hypothetical protein
MGTTRLVVIRHGRVNTSLIRLAGLAVISALFVGNGFFNAAVAGTACQPLVIPTTATLMDPGSGNLNYSLATGQPGVTMTLEFYSTEVGTIDLGAGGNLNYASCNQCVRLNRDAAGESPSRLFFQDQGTLELSVVPGADPLPVVFTNLRLIEITLDSETFESIPVPNGECYSRSGSVFTDSFEN